MIVLSGKRWISRCVLAATLSLTGVAHAQEAPRIVFPQEGQAVRGEINAQFGGIPESGYVIIKLDGQFKQATAQTSFVLNTFQEFNGQDGPHKLSITGIDASGRTVGTNEVSFQVANAQIDETQDAVTLRHWTIADRIDQSVQRYGIFAESNATIDDGTAGAAAGGATGATGYLPAPLDMQFTALVRKQVRDVGMVDNSANIRYVIQQAFVRQRLGEAGATTGASPSAEGGDAPAPAPASVRAGVAAGNGSSKAPWNFELVGNARNPIKRDKWEVAPELGQYFVKMIRANGEEINATRKQPTIAVTDLLPVFPEEAIRPGASVQTTMTMIGELSKREPINVRDAPLSLTSFENIATPAGERRRVAKLESYFNLPMAQAMQIAAKLATMSGGAGAAGGAATGAEGGAAPAPAADAAVDPASIIATARTRVSRVIYFDVASRRVIRSEDTVNTYYESLAPATGGAAEGGAPAAAPTGEGGADAGAAAAPAEPTKVNYNLRIVTYLDDRVPPPTEKYNSGAGTAHGIAPGKRDQSLVREPSIERAVRR